MQAATHFDAIINPRASGVMKFGAAETEAALRGALGDRLGEVMHLPGPEIGPRLKDWAEKHKDGGRDIMMVGGDGTYRSALDTLKDYPNISLAPLPGGLCNLLTRHLGFSIDMSEAARQYADAAPVKMDLGMVNGIVYVVDVMIDPNGVGVFASREKLRDGHYAAGIGGMLWHTLGYSFARPTRLRVSEKGGAAETPFAGRLMVVTCNRLTPRPNIGGFFDWDKYKDILENLTFRTVTDAGLMAFYCFTGGPSVCIPFVNRVWDGTAEGMPSVTSKFSPVIEVRPADGDGGQIRISVDGDIKHTSFPLVFTNLPGRMRVYRPAKTAEPKRHAE